jgi:pimeloyl-ACP methyl ester carboxylesterase
VGGTVITQAGAGDKIKALVYIAALAPSEGESSAIQGKDYLESPGTSTYQIDPAGFAYLPAESFAVNFAQDLPLPATKLMAATQGPIRAKAFGDVVTVAAWRSKPSYYIVAAKDRMIAPALELAAAKKIGATTTVLQSSHVAMLSQPEKVAEVIIAAAQR